MITKKYRFRKGSNQSAPTYMILGFIVTLVTLLFIMQNVGLFTSDTGANTDNKNLNELAEAAEAKCTDVTGGGSSSVATGIDIDFNRFTDMRIDGKTLVANFEDSDAYSRQLDDSCDYTLDDTTNGDSTIDKDESYFWHFDVSHISGSSPPTIKIEASER